MMITRSVAALMALALLVVACAGPAAEAPAGSQVVVEMTDYKLTVNVPSVVRFSTSRSSLASTAPDQSVMTPASPSKSREAGILFAILSSHNCTAQMHRRVP